MIFLRSTNLKLLRQRKGNSINVFFFFFFEFVIYVSGKHLLLPGASENVATPPLVNNIYFVISPADFRFLLKMSDFSRLKGNVCLGENRSEGVTLYAVDLTRERGWCGLRWQTVYIRFS